MLWKAADQREPPAEARDITKFGWEVAKGGAVMPAVSTQAVAPVNLLDVTSCSCSALKACSQKNCSCHAVSLCCTDYCKCEGGEVRCCNPFTIHEDEDKEDEEAEGNEERDDEEGEGH